MTKHSSVLSLPVTIETKAPSEDNVMAVKLHNIHMKAGEASDETRLCSEESAEGKFEDARTKQGEAVFHVVARNGVASCFPSSVFGETKALSAETLMAVTLRKTQTKRGQKRRQRRNEVEKYTD